MYESMYVIRTTNIETSNLYYFTYTYIQLTDTFFIPVISRLGFTMK